MKPRQLNRFGNMRRELKYVAYNMWPDRSLDSNAEVGEIDEVRNGTFDAVLVNTQ